MLVQMSPGILSFAEKYGIAINDPDLIRRYRLEMDWIRDKKAEVIAMCLFEFDQEKYEKINITYQEKTLKKI